MPTEIRSLLAALAKAPLKTKATAAACALALAAAIAVAAVVAGRPHFVTLYSGLGDEERVAVEKALALAGVRYRVSDFPGPFVVYVDEGEYDAAQLAVALDGALQPPPRGIATGESGASTIFMSSAERAQAVLKREWQETERLLERLDFVQSATVTTSLVDASPLRKREPPTVSVALALRKPGGLSQEQAQNVAKLVRYRFGVPPENVVISDQSGRLLFDPSADDGAARDARELIDHAAAYDREIAAKANAHVESAFGPRKALVAVTSRWNFDHTTTVDERIDPETVALSTELRSTSTPQPGEPAVGGPAGVAANVPASAPPPTASAAPAASAPVATTKDEKKLYEASRTRVETVHAAPELERLFVSLVVDESLAARRDEVRALVEAAVGFDAARRDVIGVSVAPIAGAPDATGEPGATSASGAPSRALELLLRHGVEIAAAVGFLALLAASLRGARKLSRAASGSAAAHVAGEVDPEALARAQIEELVRSDPRRVGEILSRWVEDKTPARVGP